MNDPPQAGARPARIIHNSGTKRLWTVTRARDSPPFQEGVAKPSNVRGSSHKKHKKHKNSCAFCASCGSFPFLLQVLQHSLSKEGNPLLESDHYRFHCYSPLEDDKG